MKERFFLLVLCSLLAFHGGAQTPVISDISPKNNYPLGSVVVTGSGFSSNPANLQVWFDHVKGTIISSTDFSIEVLIPAQARFSVLEVINLTSKLSAKSTLKFLPSFYGDTFEPLKFTAPLSFTSNEEVWDLCSCDLNNDQKPDILSTKFISPANDLVVLQNQSTPGNMAFAKTVRAVGFASDHISCGDLDGDGNPDVVFTRSGAPRNSVHIIKNTSPSGGAIDLSSTAINLFLDNGHFAVRAYLHDLNKDGKPEIVVTNSFNNTVYVFINQSNAGTISFNPTPLKFTVAGATNTYDIKISDLDGDKLPELILTPFQANHIYILKNKSSGEISFAEAIRINQFGNLNKLITADFNNDGKLDIATTSTLSNQAFVLLNQTSTSISFAAAITLTTGNGPWGIDVSDIDGDKDPDILITNRNQAVVDVFLHDGNNASPAFTKTTIATPKFTRNLIAGDLDGDGKPDLAVTSFNAANAYSIDIFRNTNCHKPEILNETPLAICSGQTIKLKAVPALNVTFTWKEGTNTIKSGPDAFADITTPGSYTLTVAGDGCSLTTPALVISSSASTVPDNPVITAVTPLCTGSNLQLSTPAVAGATYAWTGPNGFTSSIINPAVNSVTEVNAGLYTLQVSVGNCRSNIVSKIIEVADLDDFEITSTNALNTICSSSSLTLSVPNQSGYSYQWKKNGVNIGGQITNSLVVTEENTYSVIITNTALSCGKEVGPESVTVLQSPVAAFNMPATACANSNVPFTNQSTNVDSRATAVFSWAFGAGKTHTGPTPPDQNYATPANYNVSLTITYTGVSGCTSTAGPKTLTITNATAPTVSANPVEICPGEISNLSVTGTYTSIEWSNGASGASTQVTQPGDYTVTATDGSGCELIGNVSVASGDIPTLVIEADKTTISLGEEVQLQATGAHTYAWTPGGSLDNPTSPTPVANPTVTTTYNVVGTLSGECSAEGEITITVTSAKLNIKPPVAFSPNGDTFNDVWIIDGIEEFAACTMNIFDGRGMRIYQKKGYANDWDGTYEGKPVPSGTYYFVFGCPDNASATGSVLIFR